MKEEQAGKICKGCGQWKPSNGFNKRAALADGLDSKCRECTAQRSRQYRADHPEFRKKQSEYYKQRRILHGERLRDYDRRRLATVERRVYQRHYRLQHEEQLKAYDQQYNVERSQVKAEHSHRRRARKKSAEGSFSAVEWESLKVQYNYTCLCCRRREPEIKLEPDHVVPLSKGGTNWITNIQPLCKQCNDRKKTQTIDYRSKENE